MADGLKEAAVGREFGEFTIDALTPETIPMARLAEYMSTLSGLLGQEDEIHFDRVEEGSLKIKYWTTRELAAEIAARPTAAIAGTAEKPTMIAFAKLNDLLESDRAVGELRFVETVVSFPGRMRVHSPTYGPIEDELAIEGQLVRIGGRDRTIHAQIRDGDVFHNCAMTRGLAMDMCHFLFGPHIRVFGKAKWLRKRDGEWEMSDFFANKFEELEDSSLGELVRNWRNVEGNGWRALADPLDEAASLRGED